MARLWITGIWLALSLGAQQPSEDPGRPVLKRGGPAQKREEVTPPPAKPTPSSLPDKEQPQPAPPRPPQKTGVKEVEVDEQGKVEKVVSDATRTRPGTDDPVMLYSLTKEDCRRMAKGMALVASIYLAAGAKEVFPGVFRYPQLHTSKDVLRLKEAKFKPNEIQAAAFHPLGTCRMGEDPNTSVVNSYLKCHDFDNVYIVDGSPFPSSLGVNPQETIMAFAHRTAEYIAGNEFKK